MILKRKDLHFIFIILEYFFLYFSLQTFCTSYSLFRKKLQLFIYFDLIAFYIFEDPLYFSLHTKFTKKLLLFCSSFDGNGAEKYKDILI